MRKILMASVVMLGMICTANAAEWVQIFHNDHRVVYIDTSSIQTPGIEGRGVAWFKHTFDLAHHYPTGEVVKELLSREVINCKTSRIAALRIIHYGEKLRILSDYETPPSDLKWEDIIPDSVSESKRNWICGLTR